MKKTLIIIVALLIFVLPLSAYSVNALNNSQHHPATSKFDSGSKMLKGNQRRWKNLVNDSKVDNINSDGFSDKPASVSTSMEQLQNHSQAVVIGTVYNLQKMNSPKNEAYTKATIHIDKVISGDHSLKNRNVYLALDGGLVSFNHWYAKSAGKPKDFEHELFVKNEEFPMPSIGSKIITGLVPNHLDEATDYNAALKQSGFTINNSFAVDDPQYNFWVKKPKTKKYVLNNAKLMKKSHDSLAQQLRKLTTDLNKKYSK